MEETMSNSVDSYFQSGRRGMRFLLMATALACLVALACVQSTAQEITLAFAPPVGKVLVQTQKTTRVKDLGNSRKQVDVGESTTRYVFKRTASGYSLLAKGVSATMTRDGRPINNPILSLLLDVVITYEIDPQGQLLDVKGFDNVRQAMERSLPPATQQALASILSEEALVNKETAEWNGRIGNFVGHSINLGETWTAAEEFPLPGGEPMTFYSITHFAEEAPCGEGTCVRIEFNYNTDPVALQQSFGKPLEELLQAVGAGDHQVEMTEGSIVGGGERLIDPSTMMIYEETLSRTIKMRVRIPGQAARWTTLEEKKEYRLRSD
jgi:hypothetical protein